MNKKLASLSLAGIGLMFSLGLASCAPSVVAEGQARPTPKPVTTLPPYPGPTLDNTQLTPPPRSTRAGGTPQRYDGLLVTPRPDEQVGLGQVVEISAPATTSPARYSIRNENKGRGADRRLVLFIHDTQTGNEVRLGSDAGHAYFGAMNEDYVFWSYLCSCDNPKWALYVYALKIGTNILISDTLQGRGFPKIDGRWVIYSSASHYSPSRSINPGELHAYNLITGDDILVTSDLFYSRDVFTPDRYYTLHGDKIAWVVADQRWTLQAYDLTLRTTYTLNIPEQLFGVWNLSVYDNIVIWWSDFWQGYDLKQDAYFSISLVPPGWENLPVGQNGLITAEDNNLHWSLELDGETHYFIVPIVSKGQGAQPTRVVPTPHWKPTASPVAMTPTPLPLPTAYP